MLAMSTRERKLEFYLQDPCYVSVLLGACAMTLRYCLPDAYIALLEKVYTEGGLMSDALEQMKKVLNGPNSYKNGEPYNFPSGKKVEKSNLMDGVCAICSTQVWETLTH
jgi:hypothetical protein